MDFLIIAAPNDQRRGTVLYNRLDLLNFPQPLIRAEIIYIKRPERVVLLFFNLIGGKIGSR